MNLAYIIRDLNANPDKWTMDYGVITRRIAEGNEDEAISIRNWNLGKLELVISHYGSRGRFNNILSLGWSARKLLRAAVKLWLEGFCERTIDKLAPAPEKPPAEKSKGRK